MSLLKVAKLASMRFLLALLLLWVAAFPAFPQTKTSATNLYSHYLKGILYLREGNIESALEEFKAAKEKDPTSGYIRLKIASCFIRLGQMEKAEQELLEVKKINPDNLDISLALIFLYSYSKKEKELEAEYEYFLKRAHEIEPQDLKISEHLAQFHFYKKDLEPAIKIYEAILEKNPDYVEGMFWLGFLYEESKNRAKAVELWKKTLVIEPTHAPTLNSLGYIYAEEGINFDEAEVMIKKALEAEPQNGAYLDSLGWVYFRRERYADAEKYLKEAIGLVKDPVIYEHLGDLYIKLGKANEAIGYYKEGLEFFPDNKNLADKLKQYGEENKTPEK